MGRGRLLVVMVGLIVMSAVARGEDEVLTLGHPERRCGSDPHCFNRIHPDIPAVARAQPDQTIIFRTRNALDLDLAARAQGRMDVIDFGAPHPLTGPVHIEGAAPGDVLAVTLLDIEPGAWGLTNISAFGFAADLSGENHEVMWQLNRREARSPTLRGVVIPNASFPGVMTTLPDQSELELMLARERDLAAAGGDVFGPEPHLATPGEICGEDGSASDECLRTIPPREHGGNMDIRYHGVGVTVYLPCYLAGCGLGIGDLHYAQGDGEVSGTAIEMDADVTLTTRLIKGGIPGMVGPRYEGPSRLMDIPSRRFFATTGFPLKAPGTIPVEMLYLDADKVARLENLSRDINLAARNALDQMLGHIVNTYGYSRAEAHIIASVAVDLRIGQLVDTPNVGVSAILPLDIFDRPPVNAESPR